MKKIYKTPVIVVVKIESEILLAASDTFDIKDGSSSSIIDNGDDIEVKSNSKWDDSWY
ncbi:MAG: hypothetical protein MR792_06530 [Paraprevotella sp.]|nr:hypothetical protein [Paraprevotella sp.]